MFTGSICQTVDNFECTFPFQFENHTYWTCTDKARGDIPAGTPWCPTDADQNGNFKSIGECKSSCQKSTYSSLL